MQHASPFSVPLGPPGPADPRIRDEDRAAIEALFTRLQAAREPRDSGAERLIERYMAAHPETRYYLAQLAVFQEHALGEAQKRIRELEQQVESLERQARAPAEPAGGGFLGSLFGQRASAAVPEQRPAPPPGPVPPPAPAPAYQAPYPAGAFGQPAGGGFLGSAASVATGVLGGMLVSHLVGSMLAPRTGFATEILPVPAPSPWGRAGDDPADRTTGNTGDAIRDVDLSGNDAGLADGAHYDFDGNGPDGAGDGLQDAGLDDGPGDDVEQI